MTPLQVLYDSTKKRRIVIFQRANGSYGFEEQRFSDDPHEMAWIPQCKDATSICASAELALAEARGRIALRRCIPKFGRVVLGVCVVMNLWTLSDACRRLLA